MEKYEEMFKKTNSDSEFGDKIVEIEAKLAPIKQIAEAFSEAGIEASEEDVR